MEVCGFQTHTRLGCDIRLDTAILAKPPPLPPKSNKAFMCFKTIESRMLAICSGKFGNIEFPAYQAKANSSDKPKDGSEIAINGHVISLDTVNPVK